MHDLRVDDRVALRPVLERDLALLEGLTQDPERTGEFAWLGWFHPRNYRREWAEGRLLSEDGGLLMVEAETTAVGFVNWRKVAAGVGAFYWEIGVALSPDARGQGHGSAAQRLLVGYLFAHTNAHRIEARTEVDNIAERRALEKAGFTCEGESRATGWRAGAWRDGVRYAVLRSDLD